MSMVLPPMTRGWWGLNTLKSQPFWCEVKGTRVLVWIKRIDWQHAKMILWLNLHVFIDRTRHVENCRDMETRPPYHKASSGLISFWVGPRSRQQPGQGFPQAKLWFVCKVATKKPQLRHWGYSRVVSEASEVLINMTRAWPEFPVAKWDDPILQAIGPSAWGISFRHETQKGLWDWAWLGTYETHWFPPKVHPSLGHHCAVGK